MFEFLIFFTFAAIAIVFSLVVVLHKNPVVSALSLVLTFFSLAVMYVLLDAPFMAALQVIVYAGAIMVLFLFVIMLLNLGHDYRRDLKGGAFAILSFGVIGLIAGLVAQQLGASGAVSGPGAAAIDAAIAERGALGAIADPLYTTYVVPFEITGILLLVAIVGALVLAKREV